MLISYSINLQLCGYLYCEQETISYKIDFFITEVRRFEFFYVFSQNDISILQICFLGIIHQSGFDLFRDDNLRQCLFTVNAAQLMPS